MAAVALALVACYGTLTAVSLLPLVGLTLAIDEVVWTGAIILFTGMAVIAVAAGVRKHGAFRPLALAILGAVLIAYTLLGPYYRLVELTGFVLLVGAAVWDLQLRNSAMTVDSRGSKTDGQAPV
jgi:hypothetical protein